MAPIALIIACAAFLAACGGSSGSQPFGANLGEPGARTDAIGRTGVDPGGRQAAERLIQSGKPGGASYKIGPEDVLEVSVFRVPELQKSVQVSETGHINLPLIGEHPVASKTAQEVERELTRILGDRYLRNPQVSVMVKEFNSQRVTVEGEVKKPGVYPLRGQTSLMQLVAQAGGFDVTAETSEIVVFRQQGAGRAAARFNFDEIRAGQVADPPLVAGDIVVVNSSAMKSAFQNVLKLLPLAGVFVALL